MQKEYEIINLISFHLDKAKDIHFNKTVEGNRKRGGHSFDCKSTSASGSKGKDLENLYNKPL